MIQTSMGKLQARLANYEAAPLRVTLAKPPGAIVRHPNPRRSPIGASSAHLQVSPSRNGQNGQLPQAPPLLHL